MASEKWKVCRSKFTGMFRVTGGKRQPIIYLCLAVFLNLSANSLHPSEKSTFCNVLNLVGEVPKSMRVIRAA